MEQSFPSCVLHSGWLWQHALNRPSKGKPAAGELPGWCIAMLSATHGAIIVPYRPCRDVLSICILCSQRLLNSHVNFSGPNGGSFHPPASLVCWAAEAILMKSFAFLGWRWSTEKRVNMIISRHGKVAEEWRPKRLVTCFLLGTDGKPLPHLLLLERRDNNATCLMGNHQCWSQWPAVSEAGLFWVRVNTECKVTPRQGQSPL